MSSPDRPEPPVAAPVPHVPYTGGEKESLHASLELHRDAVLWKL
ncbi:hypothetical protein JHY03_40360 [Streptomyces sp. CA-256286]|nr:hypothetical protein JHY03_40360 [Streptomyces sp. CA-256286]